MKVWKQRVISKETGVGTVKKQSEKRWRNLDVLDKLKENNK